MNALSLVIALVTIGHAPASRAPEPVLLDFHAEWCGPCKQMRGRVAALERDGMPIRSIDIDRAPETAARYKVTAVPTFIVVDARGNELNRTSGLQPAAELKRFYEAALAKAQPPANSRAHSAGGDDEDSDADADQDAPPRPVNPKPWQTGVRIKIIDGRSIGYGSGTVIASDPEESVILTCAHIFKRDGRKPVRPAEFPLRIMVDLFDGRLRGTSPAQVHFEESVEGKAIDYDFAHDVGLIRIRPGRRLPAARVAPAFWEPKARMRLITVGCSEGHDATAWPTIIVRPRLLNYLTEKPSYEAIECTHAPAQGRSGGGLFTEDGYVTGVCNFADYGGDHGLYATPRSIYHMLDRNRLTALYQPPRSGDDTLVADRQGRLSGPDVVARMQTDEPDPAKTRRGRGAAAAVMIPPPTLLGIADPLDDEAESDARPSASVARRTAWRRAQLGAPRAGKAEPAGIDIDAAADHDKFAPASDQPEPRAQPQPPARSGWHAVPETRAPEKGLLW